MRLARQGAIKYPVAHTVFRLLWQVPPPRFHALPAREVIGEVVTTALTFTLVFSAAHRLCTTVRGHAPLTRRLKDGFSDRDGDTVFARALVVFVCRALAGDWDAVVDRDEIFVFIGVFVARVSNPDVLTHECELHGFVLGAFGDSLRELKLGKDVLFHRSSRDTIQGAPHPSGATKTLR